MSRLRLTDPYIADLIGAEAARITATINLIASENYPSDAVSEAQASVLTSKYAEGYPGKRYYAGCSVVDKVEMCAIERCKELFKVDHVNVQPHAGCQANMAVYYAVLKPGDTILGMNLISGGHLTHGHPVNFSGTYFKSVQYGVCKETELLDYDEIELLAFTYKPRLIIVGASAYSRVIDYARMRKISDTVGAYLLADIAHIAGLVAAQLHPSPVGYADFITSTTHKTLRGPRGGLIMCNKEHAMAIDRAIIPGIQGGPFMHTIAAKAVAFYEALQPSFVEYQKQVIKNAQTMVTQFQKLGYRIVSGGTDNHLFVVDLRSINMTGHAAQELLEQNGIMVSKSCIPFDPEKPWITSGIRIGTPAITTQGKEINDCIHIVNMIDEILKHKSNVAHNVTVSSAADFK